MKWLSNQKVDHLRELLALPDLSQTSYRIVRTLGSGGMARVYLAEDTKLSRLVALKVMEGVDNTVETLSRMQSEARVIARLEHPGIVPIHDIGTLPDGGVFYVMKYVQGSSLEEFFAQTRPITERLRVFLKVCEAVAFAHARGVVHRDLKPANIMMGAYGEVLVMDWGVAKVVPSDADIPVRADRIGSPEDPDPAPMAAAADMDAPLEITETALGTVLGTPCYMAPEQALGRTDQHNRLTDIYALGAILNFLLTGHHPFENASLSQIQRHFKEERAFQPRHANPAIPRPLEAVCKKAMSMAPQDRYPSVGDLTADLESFLGGLPVSAYRENVFEKAGRWFNRNRFIVWLLLAYTVVRFLLYFLSRR